MESGALEGENAALQGEVALLEAPNTYRTGSEPIGVMVRIRTRIRLEAPVRTGIRPGLGLGLGLHRRGKMLSSSAEARQHSLGAGFSFRVG